MGGGALERRLAAWEEPEIPERRYAVFQTSARCLSTSVVVSATAGSNQTEDAMCRIGFGPMAVRAAMQMIDDQVREAEARRVAQQRRETRTASAQLTVLRRWRSWPWAVRTPHSRDV
jgi:hypothetical protein